LKWDSSVSIALERLAQGWGEPVRSWHGILFRGIRTPPRVTKCGRWKPATFLFLALQLTARTGSAQTQTNDVYDLDPEQLKAVRVYTASMYLQSDREAPSSVTVVTADQIRKFGYRTLADILESVRGFYVSNDRNYSYVGVRGFSRTGDYNDLVQLLIDGHRMNDNVYGQALIGTEFPLDVDLIDRVEIVRGPSSSLYGTGAFFAVINVITRRAPTLGGIELTGSAGGFGSYKGRATYSTAVRGADILLSGTANDSAGAARLFFPSFNSPATNNGIAENADGDSSVNFFATAKLGHFTWEFLASSRTKHIPTASFGTVFNDSRTKTRDTAGYADLQYNRTFTNRTDLSLRASYDTDAYHGVYADPSAISGGGAVLNQDLERGDWLSFNAVATRNIWSRHRVTLGAELQDNLRQNQINYDLDPYFLFLQSEKSSTDWALFGQDQFKISQQLILSAGVRYDHYQTFGGTMNPRVAIIFTPRNRTTLKLIYGQAFRAPNNYQLYFQDGFSTEANPNLKPETIKSTELVWEQDLGANFKLSTSAFYDRLENLIAQQVDPANTLLIFENSNSARSKGIELELAGKTRGEFEGRISYTLQRTVDAGTNLELTDSPPQLVKLSLFKPIFHHWLSLSGEVLYSDARKTLAGTEASGYAIANLTASSREFGGGFRVSGSVYNLFNDKYSDPVGSEIEEPALIQNGRDFRIQFTRVFHFQ
jgi:outer membrane receptor for ferrienterochelin and colicins